MSCPTATTKAAVPVAGQPGRLVYPLTVQRGRPSPDELKQVISELWACPDCNSVINHKLQVAVAHDPGCVRMRGIT
jgi:hypothetical protein